jgi:hypothetical protein
MFAVSSLTRETVFVPWSVAGGGCTIGTMIPFPTLYGTGVPDVKDGPEARRS